MIKITLPDGSVKEFNSGITPAEVALSISEGLARNVLSAAFNGKTIETVTPLTTDGSLVLIRGRIQKVKKLSGTHLPTSWHKRSKNFTLVSSSP